MLPQNVQGVSLTQTSSRASNSLVGVAHDQLPADGDSDYFITEIDDRLSYRQGWPLLPVLPVRTSHGNVPKIYAPSHPHRVEFRKILAAHNVTVQQLEIAHRFNDGKAINRSTLTLCVLSDSKESFKWADAIQGLRSYIQEKDLTLAIELIDHRIFRGLYTLPIVSTDVFRDPSHKASDLPPHSLQSLIKKHKHGIVKMLDESGSPWTSLEFWWRGLGRTREDCTPTVLIGTPVPQKKIWWEQVIPEVKRKMGAKAEKEWVVEICWREVAKVQREP